MGKKALSWILFLLKAYPIKSQTPPPGPHGPSDLTLLTVSASSLFPPVHLLTQPRPSWLCGWFLHQLSLESQELGLLG